MQTSGGCLCGRVRYAIDGEPAYQYNCHCRDCQRMSGAAYLPWLAVPAQALRVDGEPRWHARRAASGRAASEGFCAICGSRVLGKGDALPGLVLVAAGTLDDPALFQPTADIFTRAAPYWDMMDPVIDKWPDAPEEN